MTGPAGISVWRRPFGLPVVLSLALHGLAVAALGTFSLTTKVTPVQNTALKVDLVAVRSLPVVARKPAVKRTSAAKVRPVAVKRASPRRVAKASLRLRPVATRAVLHPGMPSHAIPTEPVAAVSEAPPAFIDLPRVLTPAASPAAAFAHAATFVVPEGMEPLDNGTSLSVSTGAAPVSRPVAVASSGATCLLYTSPSPRDGLLSRMPSSA